MQIIASMWLSLHYQSFSTDPVVDLGEMVRVTVSVGYVTVSIWGKPEDCEYRYILKAVADTLPSPLPSKGPFALSGSSAFEGMMDAAGLKLLDSIEVDATFLFIDYEMMWRIVSSAEQIQSAMQVVSESELRSAVIRAAEPFQTDDGKMLLNNRYRYVTATI